MRRDGFETQIFHLEARVVNSEYKYEITDTGIMDLVPRHPLDPAIGRPECKLIEINARPPGYRVSVTLGKHSDMCWDLEVAYFC